jgi:hypothetical protein
MRDTCHVVTTLLICGKWERTKRHTKGGCCVVALLRCCVVALLSVCCMGFWINVYLCICLCWHLCFRCEWAADYHGDTPHLMNYNTFPTTERKWERVCPQQLCPASFYSYIFNALFSLFFSILCRTRTFCLELFTNNGSSAGRRQRDHNARHFRSDSRSETF